MQVLSDDGALGLFQADSASQPLFLRTRSKSSCNNSRRRVGSCRNHPREDPANYLCCVFGSSGGSVGTRQTPNPEPVSQLTTW